MNQHVFKNVDELIVAVADHFVSAAVKAVAEKGEFNVVLSGGSSPEALYAKLASESYSHLIEWNKVNFFFGDERYVPANDSQFNGLMAKRVLFDPLNISPSKIFYVDTTLSPEDAAKKYNATIHHHFKNQDIKFDLILLGLGDDAHTASLFPGTKVLSDKSVSIQSNFLPQKNIFRITMTAPMINQGKSIAFLVYGKGKAEAIRHIFEDDFNPTEYPAQLIQGEVQWFLDEAAVSALSK